MTTIRTAEDVVAMANDNGMLLYAHGHGEPHWPAMQSALDRKLIEFLRDAQGEPKRSWYKLTAAGRKMRGLS